MSTNDPALLLPDVMAKVAALEPNALAAVHRFLLRLELAQLTEEIQDEAETLRLAGMLEPELLEAAIREHRGKHPYAR
jgi:hypothetical protein